MGIIRRLFRLVRWLAFAGLIVFAAVAVAMLWTSSEIKKTYGGPDGITEQVDVAIVLGGGTKSDLILDYSSRQRVRMGVYHLKQDNVRYLIMSGGMMKGLEITAATAMRDFAVELGADPAKVFLEEQARTTFENLRFSFEIMEKNGWSTFAIVSDTYHLARARELARFLGKEPSGLGASSSLSSEPLPMKIAITLRETAAWGYNLYKVMAWRALETLGYSEDDRAEMVF